MRELTTSQLSLALALAAMLLVLVSALVEGGRPRVRAAVTVLFGLLAAGALYVHPNQWEGRRTGGFVHSHEQFHFFLGSKYLPEVRYDGLYLATLAVEEERRGGVMPPWEIRDTSTFEVQKASEVVDEAHAVKDRFSPERWAAYKEDVGRLEREIDARTRRIVTDHGNTGSPSWALMALPFTANLEMTRVHATVMAAIDPVLLLVLFGTTWACLGARTAFLVTLLALLPVRAWDYLGGSILRLDWLVALGMSANMLATKRYRAAGVFLGYAVGSKVFCGLVALALGLRFAVQALRTRRVERGHVQLVAFAFVGLLVSALVSALVFGGVDIWVDYVRRILESLHEGYYRSQHSLRDLFLQIAHDPVHALVQPVPEQIWAGARRVSIDQYPWSFLAVRLLALAALTFVLARHDEMFAWWVGVLFIFVVLVTNMYYWQMLLLAGLAAGRPGAPRRHALVLAGALWLAAAGRLAEQIALPIGNQGYFGSFWLFWTCVLLVGGELALWGWERVRGRTAG